MHYTITVFIEFLFASIFDFSFLWNNLILCLHDINLFDTCMKKFIVNNLCGEQLHCRGW